MSATIETRVTLIQELQRALPLNEYGLPEGFYRVDLLPLPSSKGEEEEGNPVAELTTGNGEVSEPINVDHSCSLPVDHTAQDTRGQYELDLNLPVYEVNGGYSTATPDGTNGAGIKAAGVGAPTLMSVVDDDPLLLIALRAGVSVDDLHNAFVPLTYSEGFPALFDGRPFWEKLDFEPGDSYELFIKYRDAGRSEARQIFLLEDDRNTLQSLRELSIMYFWGPRVKSWDLFRVAAHRKRQELRALDLLDDHFLLATSILNKLKAYFDDDDEFAECLTPKVAADLLKTVTQLQRLSVGLPAGTVPALDDGIAGPGSSLEVILRSLSSKQAPTKTLSLQDDGTYALDQFLQDPETAHMAQELVLKFHTSPIPSDKRKLN